MSKTDFSKMSRQELRRYIIKHRNDEEAIHSSLGILALYGGLVA